MYSNLEVKRGDIWYTNLPIGIGSEQNGRRPMLIMQNDMGNKYSPTVIVAVITSQIDKAKLPTHVEINGYGLDRNSVILLEQIKTLDKKRLDKYVGHANDYIMNKVNEATIISLKLAEDKKVKIAKGKANKIRTIENTLADMVRYNSINNEMFKAYTKDRELYLKDLEYFCNNNKLNYTDYYKMYEVEQEMAV